jgi:hypothetical protein
MAIGVSIQLLLNFVQYFVVVHASLNQRVDVQYAALAGWQLNLHRMSGDFVKVSDSEDFTETIHDAQIGLQI